MVKMGKTISSVPQDNSKSQGADASRIKEIQMRMDTAGCLGELRVQKDLPVDSKARKDHEKLVDKVSWFVSDFAGSIIKNAAHVTETRISEIKDMLAGLDPFIAGEILLSIEKTSDVAALTNKAFIDSLGRFDVDIACALLYEIRLTGNTAALTQEGLFTDYAVNFLNRLGAEAASEWMNSIGMTGIPGSFGVLTSEKAMGGNVIDAIGGSAKIASELSYAIGVTGKVDELTDSGFLDSLKGLKRDAAASLLSRIWYKGSIDGLTNIKTIGKIGRGELDVWDDAATINNNRGTALPPVIIAKLGADHHDRGAKLKAQLMADSGLRVVYISAKSSGEVMDAARRVGAGAIGFSMMDDSQKSIVAETVERIKSQSISGIKIFGGGAITQDTVKDLQRLGVNMFGQGITNDAALLTFLGTTMPNAQKSANPSVTQIPWVGIAASNTYANAGYTFAALGVSYAMPLGVQIVASTNSRQALDLATPIHYDSDEDSKRKKKLEISNMHTNPQKADNIKEEYLNIASNNPPQSSSKIDAAGLQYAATAVKTPIKTLEYNVTSTLLKGVQYTNIATSTVSVLSQPSLNMRAHVEPGFTFGVSIHHHDGIEKKRGFENTSAVPAEIKTSMNKEEKPLEIPAFYTKPQQMSKPSMTILQSASEKAPIRMAVIASVGSRGTQYDQIAAYPSVETSKDASNTWRTAELSFVAATYSDLGEYAKKKRTLPNSTMDFDSKSNDPQKDLPQAPVFHDRLQVAPESDVTKPQKIALGVKVPINVSSSSTVSAEPKEIQPVRIASHGAQTVSQTIIIDPPLKIRVIKAAVNIIAESITSAVISDIQPKIAPIKVQIHCQNGVISTKPITITSSVAPVTFAPLPITVQNEIKRPECITITKVIASDTDPSRDKSPASKIPNPNKKRIIPASSVPQSASSKAPTAEQQQPSVKQPVAARKGLKMSAPISWNMNIFGRAAAGFKKFNTARKEKSLEKLFRRARNSATSLKRRQNVSASTFAH